MQIPLPPTSYDYYRRVLLRHFRQNRTATNNPDTIFFYGFSQTHLSELFDAVPAALAELSRPTAVVNCTGKSYRQVLIEAARAMGASVPDHVKVHNAFSTVEAALRNAALTLVVESLSALKTPNKPGIARSLIKIMDDAHFDNFIAMSDVILIDDASFLQQSWHSIGPYLRPVCALDSFRAWMDELDDKHGRPTLRPV